MSSRRRSDRGSAVISWPGEQLPGEAVQLPDADDVGRGFQGAQRVTDRAGCAVVYDAVGKDVFLPSLDCLRPMGMAINYGTASGDVAAFDLQRLHAKSLTVSRPTLRTFVADPHDLRRSAATLFAAVQQGQVRLEVNRHYALADARQAHADIEARLTVGDRKSVV